MSQNNSNDKAAMLAKIEKINEVSGFDPAPFAVDYTDLNTGETRKRLPVMIQMAWFRMKYPEGKISVQVTPAKDCFVATAREYPKYSNRRIQGLSGRQAFRVSKGMGTDGGGRDSAPQCRFRSAILYGGRGL